MAIDPVSVTKAYQSVANAAQDKLKSGADNVDFGALVENAIRDTHQTSKAAETQSMNAVTGKGDIVDVVTAIAAAESSLETMVAVRDQVIQAYQEIMRMPI
jgi:flagellar hook-basal body complex protein FliE